MSAPLARPGKIVCVGRNYAAHARELGNDVPTHPLIFFKPATSLLVSGAPVVLPSVSSRVEFEGEIAVVVGRRLRRAGEDEARAALSHLLPLNDITARDLQRSDGQWTRAKGFDTFCPVGSPVALTPDADLAALEVITSVNGDVRQHGRSADMIFSIPFLVSWISQAMTLEPGDLISTGTPEGVGPLAPGDSVRVEVPGFGSVTNPVVAE